MVSVVKNLSASAGDMRETVSDPWVGEDLPGGGHGNHLYPGLETQVPSPVSGRYPCWRRPWATQTSRACWNPHGQRSLRPHSIRLQRVDLAHMVYIYMWYNACVYMYVCVLTSYSVCMYQFSLFSAQLETDSFATP